MHLNDQLLKIFGFTVYLSIGFVFIFIVILGNINLQKMNDPYYACQTYTEQELQNSYNPKKGLVIKVDKGDLTELRNVLEEHGLEVERVNMYANSFFMNFTVTAASDQDVSKSLCMLQDRIAVSDVNALR